MRRISRASVALLPLALAACVMSPAPEIATPAPAMPEAFFYRPEAATASARRSAISRGR